MNSLPLKRQKQKEAGRCLTPDWPLLVSLEQIMNNKTNTYREGRRVRQSRDAREGSAVLCGRSDRGAAVTTKLYIPVSELRVALEGEK